jgi:hypothetical protein
MAEHLALGCSEEKAHVAASPGYPRCSRRNHARRASRLCRGNVYMRMHNTLGTIHADQLFVPRFPSRGQPAEAPGAWR